MVAWHCAAVWVCACAVVFCLQRMCIMISRVVAAVRMGRLASSVWGGCFFDEGMVGGWVGPGVFGAGCL